MRRNIHTEERIGSVGATQGSPSSFHEMRLREERAMWGDRLIGNDTRDREMYPGKYEEGVGGREGLNKNSGFGIESMI
jgi:hypothetical protein